MAAMTTIDLSVSGMTCGSCARHVTEALTGVEGVAGARVDLGAGRATVEFDPAGATPEAMLRAVEEAGYAASVAAAPACAELPVRRGCGCGCSSAA